MKHLYFFLLTIVALFAFSCKKSSVPGPVNTPGNQSLKNAVLSISAGGELVPAVIDTSLASANPTITFTLTDAIDPHAVTLNFSLASNITAAIGNVAIKSGDVIDLSKQQNLTVNSADNSRQVTFSLIPRTELQYFGISGSIISQKSLNKGYNFYIDQFDGSTYQAINCGPTVTTMAIKWADSTFTRTPLDARNEILPGGGWWYTNNIQHYLDEHSISYAVDTLADLPDLIKKSIDNGEAVILCLDMYSVPYNSIIYEHTQKFYPTAAVGWGHFLLIKGYRQTSTSFYLEAYDPYSDGLKYSAIGDKQLFGRDRYYRSDGIKTATDVWWPYAIIIAPKGHPVLASSHLKINTIHKAIPVAGGQ